jgi:hypothetical protein
MADDDAALGEQILNVAEAEVETKIQPHGVRDDLGRKAIAMVSRSVERLSLIAAQLDNSF